MRITYNSYSNKHRDIPCEHDLGVWIENHLGGGIESQLRKIAQLTVLFTEDMLARHPDRIGQVVDILDASGTDHKVEHD